ncbi:MAG: hypothetical protein IJM46_14495 [Oscillospiraceae bacterium]|nr:hypothetical protein [Oscillospiraceae bacterium]
MGIRKSNLSDAEATAEECGKICIAPELTEQQRGIYGIYICTQDGSEHCAYIGKSEQLAERAIQHKMKILCGESLPSVNAAMQDEAVRCIEIRLAEAVPYQFDNYYKDAQRLASRETYWIDHYQMQDMCLEQVPEGRRPSPAQYEKLKQTQKGSNA